MRLQKTPFALAALALCGAIPLGAQTTSTTIQAETMSRSNYDIDGSFIKVRTTSVTGTATRTFTGTSGTYNIQVHVLLENDGRPTLELWKGTSTRLQTYSYPASSGLTPASFTVSNVPLNNGEVLRLVGRPNGGAYARVDRIVLTRVGDIPGSGGSGGGASYQGTPFSGTPIALPKAFPASDFDRGGQNVAYRDLTSGNSGNAYRTSDSVDIRATSDSQSNGYEVFNFQTGEWMAYTVNVPTTGTYDLAIRASNNQTTAASFHIEVDGANVTGPVSVPRTGSWSSYQWVGKQGINLSAGKRVIKLVSDQQYFGVAALSVLASASSQSGVSFKTPAPNQQLSGSIEQSAACELAGSGIKSVQFALGSTPLNREGGAPWQCNLDTRKFADGAHLLKATATLSDGKTALAEVPVIIKNNSSTPPPSNYPYGVYFKTPAANQQLSGSISQSSACEATGSGIARVQFSLGATPLNLEGGAPWQCNIDTTKFSNGTHMLKALATYVDGKTGYAEIPVSIQNGGSSGGPVPSNPPSGADFFCSFENAPADCGFREQAKEAGRATLVSIARAGSRSVRLHTEPGDSGVSGSGASVRNDLSLDQAKTGCYQGAEQWWAHSVLFPSDYVVPSQFGVVADFHHTGSTGQANWHVDSMPSGLRLRGYGGATVDSGRYEVNLGPVVRNQWYDFVYHVKWSSGSDGFMNVWVNGVRKMSHRGPTLYAGQGCYFKLANYHAGTPSPSSVIHDRVVRGNSAAAVAITPLQ